MFETGKHMTDFRRSLLGSAAFLLTIISSNLFAAAHTSVSTAMDPLEMLQQLDPRQQEAVLDRLDEEFFRDPDDLTELLHDYVARNAVEILGAVDVGI